MRLLHLEDSVPDAELVREILHAEWPDCEVERVERRADFHAALQRGEFDVIVSDYSLPDFDGLSALELAREVRPQAPFIFLSGTIGEERAVNALKRGATDYVIKDHLPHLLPVIRQALAVVEETQRRRRSEEALRQNQERFRTITENVADLIAMFDRSGRRTYANPAYCRSLGCEEQGAEGQAFQEIHPDDRGRVREGWREIMETGVGRRIDYRFLLRNGGVRHIEAQTSAVREADGGVTHVLEVARDVTERRKAELQLREQAALLDKARDAIIATDPSLRITYWNASAERLYGWTAKEAVGCKLGELRLGFDVPRFIAAQKEVERTGEWRGEYQLRTKAGNLVHVLSTWSRVAGASGQPSSILFIDTDITERKQLEAALLRTQRLESIGTLAGGVAHDLNNVLTPILLTTDLLRPKITDDEGLGLIASIEGSAQHGAALVKQLLAFARGSDGARAVVRVESLLPDLEGLIRTSLPDTVELTVRSGGGLRPIFGDVTQLKQVLVNLCINSRDAMPDGGKIEVLAENVDVGPELARMNPGAQEGGYLCIEVTDTGSGIPPDVAERIFDPFFTTKPAGKGTGLGLSVASGIIKSHGGFIQMQTVVGEGTTFRVFLPTHVERAVAVAPPRVAVPKVGQQEGILIVDDEPIVRAVVKMLLEKSGFRVFSAVNGADGLEKFHAHRSEIEVVLTDMNMPEMDGAEFIFALRKIDPTRPIVILSGSMETETFEHAVPGPAIECLSKPPSPAHLIETIRKNLPQRAA